MQGDIVEIICAVVDVQFPCDAVPRMYDALTITEGKLTLEVEAGLCKVLVNGKGVY